MLVGNRPVSALGNGSIVVHFNELYTKELRCDVRLLITT